MKVHGLAVGVLIFMNAGGLMAVNIETVLVGNPGNVGELSGTGAGGFGPDRMCGSVGYSYSIGKYEVTAAQYCEFLNAVAAVDTYGLYNTQMWNSNEGCKIERSGESGTYEYTVATEWANRPVNLVSWGDAARFANWLTNGQPVGEQDLSTTESGSYYLNGATSAGDLQGIHRTANARYVIPSEDEWYKAAYYDPGFGGYWDYPTASNDMPSNNLATPSPGNNANFYTEGDGLTLGAPYYRTEVGFFSDSSSAYGTFDQGGNVVEWNEGLVPWADGNIYRGLRGGSCFPPGGVWNNNPYAGFVLSAADRHGCDWPTVEYTSFGFRIAEVPEPATLSFLVLGGLAVIRNRRK